MFYLTQIVKIDRFESMCQITASILRAEMYYARV